MTLSAQSILAYENMIATLTTQRVAAEQARDVAQVQRDELQDDLADAVTERNHWRDANTQLEHERDAWEENYDRAMKDRDMWKAEAKAERKNADLAERRYGEVLDAMSDTDAWTYPAGKADTILAAWWEHAEQGAPRVGDLCITHPRVGHWNVYVETAVGHVFASPYGVRILRRATPKPTEAERPDGAEALDELVDMSIRGCSDITSPATVRVIADGLAESGVRAPIEPEPEPTEAERLRDLIDQWEANALDQKLPQYLIERGVRVVEQEADDE